MLTRAPEPHPWRRRQPLSRTASNALACACAAAGLAINMATIPMPIVLHEALAGPLPSVERTP